MCKCNRKISNDLNHIRILAMSMAGQTGEAQIIYKTGSGYNFTSISDYLGKEIIETIYAN